MSEKILSYKYKVVALGSTRSAKLSFLQEFTRHYKSNSYVGFNIASKEVFAEGSVFKLIIWDIDEHKRAYCKFIQQSAYKFARAAIIFCDITSTSYIENIHNYILSIRSISGDIPIVVIGTENQKRIPDEEIAFVRQEIEHIDNISTFFFYDKLIDKHIVEGLFIEICSLIHERPLAGLSTKERRKLDKFTEFYSICPICGIKNHISYLWDFYMDRDGQKQQLKHILIVMMNKLGSQGVSMQLIRNTSIKVGVPCCKCYRKIFGKQ
ncbi:MAG: hypothetical protein GF364_14600 [Candidatus Lokiarchaeota archaeon]|nr:hypothetical protein [Candidatus Lokiarchaeota archaeon]